MSDDVVMFVSPKSHLICSLSCGFNTFSTTPHPVSPSIPLWWCHALHRRELQVISCSQFLPCLSFLLLSSLSSSLKHQVNFQTCSMCWHSNISLSIYGSICLGGLGVTCSPRDPRFVGSNPAEVDGFFQDLKIVNTSPPGGTLNQEARVWDFRLVKESQAWKNRPLGKI